MTQRIVVGVDGWTHSVVALRHAIEEARRRDAELDLVYAYRVPTLGAAAMYGMTVPRRHVRTPSATRWRSSTA